MSLVSFPSWGLSMDDLVKREGLYYKKFTDVPFTGKTDEGRFQRSFQHGKYHGPYEYYHGNGQLWIRGTYENGKNEGPSEGYYDTGQLMVRGNHKNNIKDGSWERYFDDGRIQYKGKYKNDNREGSWESYKSDGTVDEEGTGVFKNGVKVSEW